MSKPGEKTVLGEQRSSDVGTSALIAVPVGSLEHHGQHLPLDTDTRIATAVAQAVPGGMVAPAVAYGASGEHDGQAGTISIGIAALETVLVEYGRSACLWASRVVFVNGHGGNASAVRGAVMLLRHEGRDVAWFPCSSTGSDAHAGVAETSIMLALDPSAVSGNPATATEKDGRATLDSVCEHFRVSVSAWKPGSSGSLA